MIRFFRKIRHKLLNENKFSKYLLYALGEIILVVIGILLALQINNWNINSKLKVQEVTIIREVERNIESNIAEMTLDLEEITHRINSIEIIVDQLNSEREYHDSLATHFGRINSYRYFNGVETGYQLMLSKGTENILNDDLRIRLTTYFGEDLEDINHSMNLLQKHYNQYILDLFRLHFEVDATKAFFSEKAIAVPIDYNDLKKDKTFVSSLNLYKSVHVWTQLMLNHSIDKSEQTLIDIGEHTKTVLN